MLTVWCVLNGTKYRDEDAHILRAMVARHLQAPHRFRCLSDRPIAGIDCLVLADRWPGWWAKLQLFQVEHEQALYLDLDCVVVGSLDPLVCPRRQARQLSLPANWALSGWGGCQSSVMSWGGNQSWLLRDFDPAQIGVPENGNCGAYGPDRLWGDQEYITSVAGNPGAGVVWPMPGVYSYKYHCHGGKPPADAAVVCFHGEPKPGAVGDAWVRAARAV